MAKCNDIIGDQPAQAHLSADKPFYCELERSLQAKHSQAEVLHDPLHHTHDQKCRLQKNRASLTASNRPIF